jgi:glycosyltransferase involved in cell wall biosynthesis
MTAASYGVIIPCFNSEETILETLHSVISQSFPPKQVIVVNDGSLDLTEKLVADFIKPYANYQIVTTPNMGLSAARNLGIKMLDDCDFIAFLDSDDIWHESKMELQIKILQKENDFVGICCDFSNFTDDKNNSVRVRHNFYGATQRGILLQASKIWGSGSAVVIRKKPLRDQNIFDPRLRFAEDLDAWCSIRELGEWGFLPDNLVSIRNSSGSMQGKLSHNPEIYLQSFELILEKW